MRPFANSLRLAAGSMVVLVLLISLAASAAPLSAQSETLKARRLWKGETGNFCCFSPPRPSLDGRFIPGVDWSSGDLAYLDLEQDRWMRVSDTRGWSYPDLSLVAIFSPDGTQMAHSRWSDSNQAWDLRVVDVDGENTRVLISPSPDEMWWPLDWSPDGQFILAAHAFGVRGNTHYQFLLVPANGEEVTVIKEFDLTVNHNATNGRFSPDGKWIAYTDYSGEPPLADVRLLSLDGKVDRGLVTGNGDDKLMDWLPDGSGILFHSERNLTEAIWRLPMQNGSPAGDPEILETDVWDLIPLGFGSAGFYYMVPTEAPQVYTVTLDLQRGELASAPTPVRELSAGAGKLPAWSPDGRQLAFLSETSTISSWDVVIKSLETGETHTIPIPFDNPTTMLWGPDVRTLTFRAGYQGVGGMYRFDLQSGEVTTLVSSGWDGTGMEPKLSTDGRTVFYGVRSASGEREFRARDLDTGRDRVITRWEGVHARIREIPGGKGYVVMRNVSDAADAPLRITLMNADGVEEGTLWEGPNDFLAMEVLLRVTQDGKYLLLAGDENGTFVLQSFDLETGERQEVYRGSDGDPAGAMSKFALHPDGSRIAFTRGGRRGEIWLMEGFR